MVALPTPLMSTAPGGVPKLRVEGLSVSFAGIRALDDVSFTVSSGSVHALIGPNGAGKPTCFNVISGVYRATAGRVRFGENVLTGLPPHRIAGLGVARTFQNLALSPTQPVRETLVLGRHHLTHTGFLSAGLRLPRATREEARHRGRVEEIASFMDLPCRAPRRQPSSSVGLAGFEPATP